MPVIRRGRELGSLNVELHDQDGPVDAVNQFLSYLRARGSSPNTVLAYAYDLDHLWRFLHARGLTWLDLRPPHVLELLTFLREHPVRRTAHRLSLAVAGASGIHLSGASINRTLTGISAFYDWAIAAALFDGRHPIERRPDPSWQRVSDRHRAFIGSASRYRPERRVITVRTVRRLPRPLSEEQVDALLSALRSRRDRALVLVMLQGGLRPGEALGLHLADVAYGRRRVFVRVRDDHPKGARSKSRSERVVDIWEPEALAAVSDYVMHERPGDGDSAFVFLVGGGGRRRIEPLSYWALARLFARAAERAGIREAWMTPHALRHTHATRMWEGGMRELTLQRRLGHASVESTRVYTRVSDEQVAMEYQQALGRARLR